MHPNCPLWRCSYREDKLCSRTLSLASLYLWGSDWYVILIEEMRIDRRSRVPAGGAQAANSLFVRSAFFDFQKHGIFGGGGSRNVEATAPLFGVDCGHLA